MSIRINPALGVLCAAVSCLGCSASDGGQGPGAVDECESVTCVDALPAQLSGTTLGATHVVHDAYSCAAAAGRDLSGPEVVHRITVVEEGFLSVAKTVGAPDSFLFLLAADDAATCVDAHRTNVGAWLAPGAHYVVVDGPAGMEGDFELRAAHTTPASLTAAGIDASFAADALGIYRNAWAWGASRRPEYAIVDFRAHSAQKREWVFDLSTGELLWNLRVAHGRKSTDGLDLAHAIQFSNEPGSNQSSLGLLRSAGTYTGSFGASFRLEGLEPGFNDEVCARDIVMHPWAPVGDAYVAKCGWARPSLGCPAIDDAISLPVRDRLARPDGQPLDAGVLMLFWYPNTTWHAQSEYLHGTAPTAALTSQQLVECDSSQDGTPQATGTYACD